MQATYIHFIIPFASAEPPAMYYVLFSILTVKQNMTFGFNFDTKKDIKTFCCKLNTTKFPNISVIQNVYKTPTFLQHENCPKA